MEVMYKLKEIQLIFYKIIKINWKIILNIKEKEIG